MSGTLFHTTAASALAKMAAAGLDPSQVGMLVVTVLGLVLLTAFLRRVLFTWVADTGALTALGDLDDPIPPEPWRERGAMLAPRITRPRGC